MLYSLPLPYLSDASPYFHALRELTCATWLDSGGMARFDIMVAAPVATLSTRGEQTVISTAAGRHEERGDPFGLVRAELGGEIDPIPGIPFSGGAVGYWSYELSYPGRRLPTRRQVKAAMPHMAIGIYDWALVVDHHEHEARLVSRLKYPQTEALLEQLWKKLNAKAARVQNLTEFRVHGAPVSNLSPVQYQAAYDSVQSYLQEGDCYQVNLAQRFAAKATGDAYAAYLEFRKLSPAPFSAFMDLPEGQILCASPERFLRVREGRVETKPIKGTRRRSENPAEDRELAQDLLKNPKDRAENLMIVDLLRNDLGKSCKTGTVRTTSLFELESYSNVHHLVSTIEGELASGRDALHVLRDCFPGGSITGAPKRRAMEIIEQLEPDQRGVYCGSIGYIGFDGEMDSNIAIRTMVYTDGEIHCWAGGGIVADSNCEDEYRETLDKASGMLGVLKRFSA